MKGRKKRMKKKNILIVTVLQVLLWATFIFGDYLEEAAISDRSMFGGFFFSFAILILPVVVGILYLVFQRKLCQYNDILLCKGPSFFLNIWLVEIIGMLLGGGLGVYMLLFLPIHLPMIFYLLTSLFPMRLSRHIDILKLKTFAFLSNIWGMETLLFGILIIRLVSTNTWIVYQDQGKLLNGIEYYMFCWICAVVPITVVMAGKILAFLCLAFAEGKEVP